MRIAIVSDNDTIWALRAWEHAIPMLKNEGYEVAGIVNCEDKLGPYRGFAITRWYLESFGVFEFCKLGALAVVLWLRRAYSMFFSGGVMSFAALAKKQGISYTMCRSPNDPSLGEWMKSEEIDILIIMVGHILSEQTLRAPRIGTINKHAAALPSNKGLLPYFWAELKGIQHGISFHKVTAGIDEGELLLQDKHIPERVTRSLVAFYGYVFRIYPEMLLKAVRAMKLSETIAPTQDIQASYHSLPTRKQVREFYRKGGRIVRFRDIVSAAMGRLM